ncbi:MAG: acyl-CoA/acyl-ACP dehydrogenase [Gammaproteobacteria bacterium]|nr:acyl-CoA/acyl-ACP dehydrogenase [Gammaproteobacteria bacterium]MBQ0839861.1 acyl-CoA/acyl-ACP dehydrogenase [Gammaproteobacteria bacterium]
MTDSDNIIFDTASRILDDLSTAETINAAEEGVWPEALWQAISESGLTLTWVPEENGGAGASMLDGFAVIKAAGGAAAPIPLAETLFAGWLLTQVNLQVSGEAATVALGELSLSDGKLSGTALGVPYARGAQQIIALVESGGQTQVVQVAAEQCEISAHTNLAGEPSDQVTFKAVPAKQVAVLGNGVNGQSVEAMGALIRCVQSAGALSAALELTIEYSMERVQFGRAIGKFQALQHSIAAFAGEVAAMNAAADAAAEAVANAGGVDHDAWIEIATAKTRLEEAVNNGAAVAHQVHGAMGFTYEHSLHHLTRRLWSWRDEYGSDVVWAKRLGEEVLSWGADQLWPKITAVTDPR